jgi:hypothetical protein
LLRQRPFGRRQHCEDADGTGNFSNRMNQDSPLFECSHKDSYNTTFE